MNKLFVFCLLAPCVLSAVITHDNEVEGRDDKTWTIADKILKSCSHTDITTCLSVKAVSFLTRVARMDTIRIMDGVEFVKTADDGDRTGRAMTESELENELPQEPSEKSSRLFDLFLDAAVRFLKTHSLQFKLPESVNLQRSLEEARGKKQVKKMLTPIILAVVAKLVALVPIIFGGVGLLAIKALVVAKIAFVLAAVLAVQKFFGGKLSGGGNTGWSSGGSGGWSSGGSGGPYYRSFDVNAANDMAYKGQIPDKS